MCISFLKYHFIQFSLSSALNYWPIYCSFIMYHPPALLCNPISSLSHYISVEVNFLRNAECNRVELAKWIFLIQMSGGGYHYFVYIFRHMKMEHTAVNMLLTMSSKTGSVQNTFPPQCLCNLVLVPYWWQCRINRTWGSISAIGSKGLSKGEHKQVGPLMSLEPQSNCSQMPPDLKDIPLDFPICHRRFWSTTPYSYP